MNRSLHVWQKRVRIGETNVGQAVFAVKAFRKGQTIGVIQGVVIDDANYGSTYCMDLGGTRSLEPIEPFRFLNHCCEPNAELVTIEYEDHFDGPRHMYLDAIKAIAPGDEITIDYAWDPDNAIPCLCGHENCRGWVVDETRLDQVKKRRKSTKAKSVSAS